MVDLAGAAMMASTPAPIPLPPTPSPAAPPPLLRRQRRRLSDRTLAFRLFLSRLSDSVRRSLSNRRPWSVLLDRSAFSRSDSLSEAASRIRKNLIYFRVNYIAILTHSLFSLLVLLGLLTAWCFPYLFRPADPPLVLFGRTFSDRETLGGLALLSIFVIFLTSVGSLLISALLVGAAIVCAHGPSACSRASSSTSGIPAPPPPPLPRLMMMSV